MVGNDSSSRAGRIAALIVWMAGGEEAFRPEERARVEEVCEQVLRGRTKRSAGKLVGWAIDQGMVRPEDRARAEKDFELVIARGGEGTREDPTLPEILEAMRARPDLAEVGRTVESTWRAYDRLVDVVFADEPSEEEAEPVHGLGNGAVVLNVGGLEDPRQIRAVAEVAREGASAPDAKRVLLVGAETLDPRMRAELVAALGDETSGPGRPGGATATDGGDEGGA